MEASKEYTNSKGKKAVSTVYIPKTISGKSVIARVAHSFSSGNISCFAHTVD